MTRYLQDQSLTFRVAAGSGVPPYLQIVTQVEQALRMGILRPGDRLPTVKEAVTDTAVNPNTVLKAYRELEHAGLVEGRQGVGTFVLARPSGPPPDIHVQLAQRLGRWVQSARAEGLDEPAMRALFDATLHDTAVEGAA